MISVCIATYNASIYIHAQIISILNQLAQNDEIIISDDLSTDNTIEIITNINDARIKVIKGDSTLGVVKNFERALFAAKGDLIFLADQDDVWLPNKVQVCKTLLVNYILVVSDCAVVDSNLNSLSPSFFALKNSKKGVLKNIYKNSYIGCCMAFKRELLDIALPFPKTIPMHDIWIGLLADIVGDVVFTKERLLLYRRHKANLSPMQSNSRLFTKIKIRFVLLASLLNRFLIIFFKSSIQMLPKRYK
ncbi:MAG: alpha-L-Rha alpha-1,3-L-rhamnosyltransferase [Methylotenera sp.]|nr:MAG: alpha-L-Rha alpha-1,3-L-rhamnosyltransferase [Methylotenera sp.]